MGEVVDKYYNAEDSIPQETLQMYATMTSPVANPFGARQPNNMYRQIGIETGVSTASPHQLVVLLLDGALDAINRARGAIRANDIEAKGKAIRKAVAIVDEGLKSCLNLQEGGELAQNLSNLYAYVTTRLTYANLHSDEAVLTECATLLQPLREAWGGISGQNVEQERVNYLKGIQA
jgi:flagellar secretion chaperone FliS